VVCNCKPAVHSCINSHTYCEVNARHHSENVVIRRINAHRGAEVQAHRVVAHRQQQRRVVNAGQVARAAGLVLLRLQREGVHVDTHGRDVRVVLVRLHQVEVRALTHLEAIVAVELQQSRDDRVAARHTLHARHGVAALQHRAIPPVRVVERLLALVRADHRVVAADERVTLHNPHELLARVVEVQLQLVAGGRDALTARELQHIDQVLVGDLGELAALIRVQVDVVHVQGRRGQARLRNAVADGVRVAGVGRVPAQVVQRVELQIDAHLVVLQRDQRQRQTRVAAEPELQRDVQRVHRRAAAQRLARVRRTRVAVVGAWIAALHDQIRQLRHVTHHLGVTSLLARLLREFIPDVQPVTIVPVNALTTDLQLHIGDQIVAHPVQPAELRTAAVRG